MQDKEFKKADFDHLFLKVHEIPEGIDLIEQFPILGAYSIFKADIGEIPRDMVIRYIIYAFDQNSPLHVINNVLELRVEAAMRAGFKPHGTEFPEDVDKMIRSVNPNINSMIIQYCIIQGEDDYTTLVVLRELLRKEQEKMLNPPDGEDISKLIKNSKELRSQIKELQQSLLVNNIDKFLTRSLTDFTEAETKELSPEHYAKLFADGYWSNVSRYHNSQKTAQTHGNDNKEEAETEE